MNRRIAFPFLVLPSETVNFRGWMLGDVNRPLSPATDLLEDWDYERDLEISCSIEVDFEKAAASLELDPDSLNLAFVIRTGTGSGTMPRRIDRLPAKKLFKQKPSVDVSTVIRGADLSARLRLEALVLLDTPSAEGGFLSPAKPGARLWQTYTDILLEGGGDSRFPIELASFTHCFRGQPQEHAPWYVHWRPGYLDADFGGAVRVYVNSDMQDVAEKFVAGDALLIQAVLGDVFSQIVASTLRMSDCEELLTNCPAGSVGQQISNWIGTAFPDQSLGSIRASLETTPGRFRAALLSAASIGDL